MIKIDRDSIGAPEVLRGPAARELRDAARLFFSLREELRQQKRFDFNLEFAQPEVQVKLRELFRDKCAYCEKLVNFDNPSFAYQDRFRPSSGAIGLSGEVSADAYWWLAFEWSNIFACCAQCNRAKGSRFPVERRRAGPDSGETALAAERPLLLDPCRDDPDRHLAFDENGHVSGKTLKGRTTVEVFNLNRKELVHLRTQVAKRLIADGHLLDLDDVAQPFTALRRQLLARMRSNVSSIARSLRDARQSQIEHEQQHSAVGLEDARRDLGRERARTRYIESVSLSNVGIHEKLTISMSASASTGAPWMVLLGENGVGKSTLLKAVAFALAGSSQWQKLGPYASALLPSKVQGRARSGKIEVRLSDGESIHMIIDAHRRRVSGNASDAKLYVLGFGATRLSPNAGHPSPLEPDYLRLINLFDAFSPLGSAQDWLLRLSDLQFERAGRTLKSLLDLPESAMFRIEGEEVALDHGGFLAPITTLSDGYQTVIGMGCDIMSILLRDDLPVEHAEGIVLIDEIGNHLHPTWRMRIVSALKRAFPRVQFIATTHEPLCLRGLDNDEVAVLRRDREHHVHLLTALPPIRGLLVDQILSSQYFGLRSTVDPEFAAQLDTYYELVAKEVLSAEEVARLGELEVLMDRLRLVGDTPREQILLKTIDAYLATADANAEPVDPSNLPDAVQKELARLLASASGALTTENLN